MQKNILQAKRIGSDYVRNTIFYGSVGILFTIFGASQLQWLGLQAVVYLEHISKTVFDKNNDASELNESKIILKEAVVAN